MSVSPGRQAAVTFVLLTVMPVPQPTPDLAAVHMAVWPQRIEEADFIVINCALTSTSRHMLNAAVLAQTKPGVRVVNVGRGPVVDEPALCAALLSGQVYSAALDVFEDEPLPASSYLRTHPRCVFGSHNASNTADAVARTSEIAIGKLMGFLGVSK